MTKGQKSLIDPTLDQEDLPEEELPPEDEESLEDSEPNWLDRMHPFMRWQVLSPKATVPFGKSLSDIVLQELSNRKDVLVKHIKLRGMIEGDELCMVAGIDPETPRGLIIESDHPNIGDLTKSDFHNYFQRKGVYDWISSELDKVQNSYKQELRIRKHRKKKAGKH